MIPASLVGVLFLVALVPGSIYLSRTDGKRKPSGDASAIEEVLALVVAGAATVLPPLFVALVLAPKHVRDTSKTAREFATASNADLEGLGWSLITIVVTSIALAYIFALIHNALSSTDAAPDVWGPTLSDTDKLHVLMVGATLIDGTFIQGASAGYSMSKNGRSRDLRLGNPIYVQRPGEELKRRKNLQHTVISESQIAHYTTSRQLRAKPQPAEQEQPDSSE